MAVVICDMEDCIHRSKHPLKAWKRPNGIPCYRCTLKDVIVGPVFDPDGDIEAVGGKKNTAICRNYQYALQ